YTSISYNEGVRLTSQLMEEGFCALTRHHDHLLVPLSGGRDSRYLLALALKHFSKDQIHTFTFGRKGSFDYEIGTRLSAKLGLDCCTISFEEKDYYEKVGRPSMYFKNGLINHLVHMPGRI